jgi:murein DD-endopeptidase MepM/ murein hydrolase activator NlpD
MRGMRGLRTRSRVVAGAIALALIPVGALAGPALADPSVRAAASARTDYPSWADVQKAQQAEGATKALVAQLTAQVQQLGDAAKAAQADADAKGDAYAKAQEAYDDQNFKTQQLQTQADAAKKDADAARLKAAQLVAQQSKTNGGIDSTATLLSQQGSADGQLYRLQAYNQLLEQSQGIYERAIQLQKNAQSLTDQATVEKKLLDQLQQKAEAALAAAQLAAQKAQDAVDAATQHQAEMQAQLAVLTQQRQATEADYQAGVAARAAAEAARRAALGAGGRVASSGWGDPASGAMLDAFGMRYHPIYHVWKLHSGQDIANACGTPLYAAHSGTIKFAGRYSDLGNYITIDHGDGVVTGYGHIVNGGILVRVGQHVDAGEHIANMGMTGGATGCHLHFMVYVNGSLTNPVPFMRDRGVTLG